MGPGGGGFLIDAVGVDCPWTMWVVRTIANAAVTLTPAIIAK
jgi:hypothetical protein